MAQRAANHFATATDRPLWIAASALTCAGLVGAMFDMLGYFPAHRLGVGGCGGLAGVFVLIIMVFLGGLGGIACLALNGFFIYYRGASYWGALQMIAANLLTMGYFGFWQAVDAGQTIWGIAVLTFAICPLAAAILLLYPLFSRGSITLRAAQTVVVLALAIPLGWLYFSGVSTDLHAVFRLPAAALAATGCGS